MAGAAGKER
ncbi:hypothetical protein LINPERPRIM_LOCUS13965 [Linum perenne]